MLNLNVGITFKSINSELIYRDESVQVLPMKSVDGRSGVGAYDVGILLVVPVWDLIDQNFQEEILRVTFQLFPH